MKLLLLSIIEHDSGLLALIPHLDLTQLGNIELRPHSNRNLTCDFSLWEYSATELYCAYPGKNSTSYDTGSTSRSNDELQGCTVQCALEEGLEPSGRFHATD